MLNGPVCPHCGLELLPCPRGAACPGYDPARVPVCTACSWGLICSVHQAGWTRT